MMKRKKKKKKKSSLSIILVYLSLLYRPPIERILAVCVQFRDWAGRFIACGADNLHGRKPRPWKFADISACVWQSQKSGCIDKFGYSRYNEDPHTAPKPNYRCTPSSGSAFLSHIRSTSSKSRGFLNQTEKESYRSDDSCAVSNCSPFPLYFIYLFIFLFPLCMLW